MIAASSCAIKDCEEVGTKLLNVETTLAGGRNIAFGFGPPTVADRMTIEVCLCPGHYDYLTRDSLRGVTLGNGEEYDRGFRDGEQGIRVRD